MQFNLLLIFFVDSCTLGETSNCSTSLKVTPGLSGGGTIDHFIQTVKIQSLVGQRTAKSPE